MYDVAVQKLSSCLANSKIACDETRIFALKPSLELVVVDRISGEAFSHLNRPSLEAKACNTTLELLQIEKRLCFGAGNQLVHVKVDSSKFEFEQICVEEEIIAGKWSPDQNYLVLVYKFGDVTVNTVDFENGFVSSVGRASLYEDAPSGVAVGWGSENTQFKGRSKVIKVDGTEGDNENSPQGI